MVLRNETDYRFLFFVAARVSVAKRLLGGLQFRGTVSIFEFELRLWMLNFFLHADKEIIINTHEQSSLVKRVY